MEEGALTMANPSPDAFRIPHVTVIGETEKAIDCRWAPDTHIAHWIARSQIELGSEVRHVGDRGLLVVSAWFAKTAKLTKVPRANG